MPATPSPASAPAFDTVEELIKSSASPVTTQCTDNLNAWDGTAADASSLTYTATMHFYLTDTSATTCLSEGACTADEECPVGYRCSFWPRARLACSSSAYCPRKANASSSFEGSGNLELRAC